MKVSGVTIDMIRSYYGESDLGRVHVIGNGEGAN